MEKSATSEWADLEALATQTTLADLDVVTELRLRRWARERYVSREDRNPTWNFVVLDEMERKDRELAGEDAVGRPSYQFVPLEPRRFRIEGAHNLDGGPTCTPETSNELYYT